MLVEIHSFKLIYISIRLVEYELERKNEVTIFNQNFNIHTVSVVCRLTS